MTRKGLALKSYVHRKSTPLRGLRI